MVGTEESDKASSILYKEIPAKRFAKGEEDFGRKKISTEEENEFLRIIQQSEFKLIEQLNKTPAKVSLLELLMNSEPRRALLVKILNEAHVAQDISMEGFRGIINNHYLQQQIVIHFSVFPLHQISDRHLNNMMRKH